MKSLTLEEAVKAMRDGKPVEFKWDTDDNRGWTELDKTVQFNGYIDHMVSLRFRLRPEPKVPMRVEFETKIRRNLMNENIDQQLFFDGPRSCLEPLAGKRVRVSVEEIIKDPHEDYAEQLDPGGNFR